MTLSGMIIRKFPYCGRVLSLNCDIMATDKISLSEGKKKYEHSQE